MESGRVKVDQMKRHYDFEIKNAKVIATANDLNGPFKTSAIPFQTPSLARIYNGSISTSRRKSVPQAFSGNGFDDRRGGMDVFDNYLTDYFI